MSKIYPIKLNKTGKIFMETLTSKKQMPKKPEIKPQTHSSFDFSTEERGFFIHNGKVINIVFPR